MSSLFGLLDIGAGALATSNAGIAVAANNTANVNTVGYSRQRLDIESQLAAPLVGGVRFGDPQRISDGLLAGRERDSAGAFGLAEAYTNALQSLEGSLMAAADVSDSISTLFARLNDVAASPLDTPTRDAAVGAAVQLALSFNRQATALQGARSDADDRIGLRAAEASGLAREIASANRALAISDDPVMADRRDRAAQRLAQLVGGAARIDPDGHMRFTLPDGSVLVDGTRSVQFATSPDPGRDNMLKLEVVDGDSRRDVTDSLEGGELAGELRFRDVASTAQLERLDQLAFDLATSFNAVHQGNAAVDGSTGRALFSISPTADGAASAIAVDPAVVADSSLLAASTPGAGPGNSQGALDLIALRDQRLAGGSSRTFTDEAIAALADLGRDTATAAIERDFHAAERDGLAALRDSVSGVSVEEELTRLSQFQHAAEASTRFLGAVDSLLGTLIESL